MVGDSLARDKVRVDHGDHNKSHRTSTTDSDPEKLRHESFNYFLYKASAVNGQVIDKTAPNWPASIAATGLALAAYPVGVERGYMTRAAAVERTLLTLRFFWNSSQGPESDATGYRGFFYHFLSMETGRRAHNCELSTVDSTFLPAGALTAGLCFSASTSDEAEIRSLADALYRRADWQWAQNGDATVTHGWTPEGGFLPYRWNGYDEALLLYVMGLGSPTHPLPEASYTAWCSTYKWKCICGQEYLFAGPLFTHQLSHIWIDFRGVQDAFMREKGIDYFENNRRATYAQQQYAIRNPLKFDGYGRDCWGITASEGPGPQTMTVNDIERQFFDCVGRGIPYGPDDGTIAPWAVVASLPFAPEIVLPALGYCIREAKLTASNPYGFKASVNPTYPEKSGNPHEWVSPWRFGLNQGPIILMIENYRTDFLWRLTRDCVYVVSGLQQAGFAEGWLDASDGLGT